MDVFWFVWNILISVIESATAYYLLVKRIGNHNFKLKPLTGAIIIFTANLLIRIFYVRDDIAMFIHLALYISYACAAFGGGWVARIVWGCMPALITLTAQILSYGIASYMNYGSIERIWFWGNVSFYMSVTTVMLQIVITLIAANTGKRNTYSLTAVQLVFLIVMSFLSIAAVNLQMGVIHTLTHMIGTQGAQKNAFLVSICFLIMLAALIWLVESLGKESQKTVEKSLEIQQAQLENNYYRELENSIKSLRELRHDISTHIHVMKNLIERGNDEELKQYFSSIETRYQSEDAAFATDNPLLNAILTSKQMAAREHHIKMELNYYTSHSIPLPPLDLCSLIGNLIDNAVEACQKVMNETARYIDIAIGDKGDMVYIKIKNCSDGIYLETDGQLQTTKTGNRHGIGLKRIRSIAEHAGGFFYVNPRPGEFTAIVMIPVTDER